MTSEQKYRRPLKANQMRLHCDLGCFGNQLWRGALYITSWILLGVMSGISQGTGVAAEIARLVLTTSENAPVGQDKEIHGLHVGNACR